MNAFVCNYAIARFRPYRETGEFANVGVVLLCPQTDFFGYCFERRKHKRITDFFPELDVEIFKAGLSGLLKEMNRLAGRSVSEDQLLLGGEAQVRIALFRELVRPRESLFHFSPVATVLAQDPRAKLDELFDFYIKRQFARDREYQEIIMRRRLADYLQKVKLAQYYRQDFQVGNETYHVTLPFVHLEHDKPRKAIKPLHLDKATPTDIYRHGDAWISTVRRLRQINCLPREFLFAVRYPAAKDKRQKAAEEICRELQQSETLTVSFGETDEILKFARC